jgi:hypothetical protein
MEPMKPMAPMQSMKPMEPMQGGEAWWPKEFGHPSSSGAQNGMRYAFFDDEQRLLIEQDGRLATYDTGRHRISGVSQDGVGHEGLKFTSQEGAVDLGVLKKISEEAA